MKRINPDRVRNMLKAERRKRGKDPNYYGSHNPGYHVARRFGITCDDVRDIAIGITCDDVRDIAMPRRSVPDEPHL